MKQISKWAALSCSARVTLQQKLDAEAPTSPARTSTHVRPQGGTHVVLHRHHTRNATMKILVVSCNPTLLIEQLDELGYTEITSLTTWPSSPPRHLEGIEIVLVDVTSGVDLGLLIHVRHALPSPILLLVGDVEESTLVDAYRAGIDDHLGKPLSSAMLRAKLRVWQRWIGQPHAVK